MDDRISFIDKIRGLAIIGVVVLHSDFLNGQCEMITFLQEMFSSSVVIFFAISGFLSGKKQNKKIQKKSKILAIKYILFTIIYTCISFVLNQIGYLSNYSLFFAPQLYFLLYLSAIQLSVSIIENFESNFACVVYILLLFYFTIAPIHRINGAGLNQFLLYFLSYGLFKNFSNSKLKPYLVVILTLQLINKSNEIFLLLLLLGILTLISCKWLEYIGSKSGVIFLWHTPLIMPFYAHIIGPSNLNMFAIYAVLIGLTIITSLVLGKMIEKQNITILMI